MKREERAHSSLFNEIDGQEEGDRNNSPAAAWDLEANKRALDELFVLTNQYRNSQRYRDLLEFITKFPRIAPFNAMLAHIQMPGARYILSAYQWQLRYGRTVRPGARPIVLLRTNGPVSFVFDVSDTEGDEMPERIVKPFEVRSGAIGAALHQTEENCKRDGVFVYSAKLGSQMGGSITTATNKRTVEFRKVSIPARYELQVAEGSTNESRYATLIHELGHLYCGHLGSPNDLWWPDRRGLSKSEVEFEAESISYMVCKRVGIATKAEEYLSGYVRNESDVPRISLECIMKAAGFIEKMSDTVMNLRRGKGQK